MRFTMKKMKAALLLLLICSLLSGSAQARDADALATFAAAYFPVLAEHAAELAAGKEYRPGAAAAAYAWLLTEVRRGSRDARQEGASAHARRRLIAASSAASAGT